MKLEVHCTRCGAHKLTLEAPPGIGPVAQTEWIDRRREEARLGDMVRCECGAEIDYEVVPVSKDAPAGVKPRDKTRPLIEEVEVNGDQLRVRGKFLNGATLQVQGKKGVTLFPLTGDDTEAVVDLHADHVADPDDPSTHQQLDVGVANEHGWREIGRTTVKNDGQVRGKRVIDPAQKGARARG